MPAVPRRPATPRVRRPPFEGRLLALFRWWWKVTVEDVLPSTELIVLSESWSASWVAAWSPPYLLCYHELPEWARDNEYILSGYRPVKECHWHVLGSLLYLHNESVNIHTHLLPLILGLLPSARLVLLQLPRLHATLADCLAFVPLLLGTAICYFCSAFFHLHLCHSPQQFAIWSKLDYLGIVVVMWGGFFTLSFFLLYHHRLLAWLLIAFHTLCCGVASAFIMQDRFATPAYRKLRAMAFGCLFFTSFLPAIAAFRDSFDAAHALAVIHPYTKCFLALFAGGVLFACRLPERLAPGLFDYLGHSHQIMHIFVVIGIGFFHEAGFQAFAHRCQPSGCTP